MEKIKQRDPLNVVIAYITAYSGIITRIEADISENQKEEVIARIKKLYPEGEVISQHRHGNKLAFDIKESNG